MTPDTHTISLDLLRAELRAATSDLKVELLREFASQKAVDDLNMHIDRVISAQDDRHTANEKRLAKLESWMWKCLGACAVVCFTVPLLMWLVYWLLTRHHS